MSADDKAAECTAGVLDTARLDADTRDQCTDEICEKKRRKPQRKVCFPDDDQIVTQYFEPANPWQHVSPTTRAQLASEYLESCRRHNTAPLECVLQQIQELPEACIGGSTRAARLSICDAALLGCAPPDALEAIFKRVQFTRLELQAAIDDEAAEALFDMVEYYESATAIVLSGPRHFGIRGWQAASRMVKKSCHLQELEISNHVLECTHAPVLARALHAHTCRLRTLCLQRAVSGEALLSLVISLKANTSVRELRLGDNSLTPADAAQIASLLRYNTRLQLLDLSNNMIQDAGLGHIADALATQSKTSPSTNASPLSPLHCPVPVSSFESRGLAFLVLWNNQLTRNCASHLSKALQSQSLCVLNIGRNAVGCDAIRALSAGGALVSLGLQCARLGPDCAAPLHDLVRQTNTLQRLDLRDNKLGCAGLQAILSALKQNTTVTQIDLDEPNESTITLTADNSEAATIARLTRDIRSQCRANEPSASPERKAHRKISLTCYSAASIASRCAPEESRGRLRSPLPSPAGSPVPAPTGSRFSVTRVTPERELPVVATPTRTTHSPSSRFKVVQVAEPPTIHIHTPEPRKSNRFSVTRNYDITFNVTPVPSPPPTPNPTSDANLSGVFEVDTTIGATPPRPKEIYDKSDGDISASEIDIDVDATIGKTPPRIKDFGLQDSASGIKRTDDKSDKETKTGSDKLNEKTGKDIAIVEISERNLDKINVKTSKNDNVHIVNIGEKAVRDLVKSNITYTDTHKKDNNYHNKTEEISHNAEVDTVGNKKVLKTETKLLTSTVDVNDIEKRDVQVQVTVKTETLDVAETAKVHNDHNMTEFKNIDDLNLNVENINVEDLKYANPVENRDDFAMQQIEAITGDLGLLIEEMRELTTKTACLTHKNVEVKIDNPAAQIRVQTSHVKDVFVKDTANANCENVNIVLKKNKSESSLDSPDLEVSRLMNKIISPFRDSSSSLEISGSSMESLNAIEQIQTSIRKSNIQIVSKPTQESDFELDRRKVDQTALSTETSIDSNTTSKTTPVNTSFLNVSVSSNESVSPLIFNSKNIHGSISSLEASVSSFESAKHERTMVTSADSGIEYSIHHPAERDKESCNEGTLTQTDAKESVNKVDSFLQDTLTSSPKRTSSLLDVPALKNKGLDKMRKISWVAPSSSFQVPKEPEKETKLPSHLEKLLSLFQHPTSLFSRSPQTEEEKKCNTPPRKDSSLTSSFWSWGSSSDKEKETEVAEVSSAVTEEHPITQASSKVTDTNKNVSKTEFCSGDTQSMTEVSEQTIETVTSSSKVSQGYIKEERISDDVTSLSSIVSQLNLEPAMFQIKQISTEITDISQVIRSTVTQDSQDSSEMSQITLSQDNDSSSTDSTLSERAQIAFIDETFSKKLDSKTSSTDTENTSEYQSAQISLDSVSQNKFNDSQNQTQEEDDSKEIGSSRNLEFIQVTDVSETTDTCNAVQSLVLSFDSSNGNESANPRACDITDLKPNDMNKNYETVDADNTDYDDVCNRREPKNVVSLENIDNVQSYDAVRNREESKNVPSLEKVDSVLNYDTLVTENKDYDGYRNREVTENVTSLEKVDSVLNYDTLVIENKYCDEVRNIIEPENVPSLDILPTSLNVQNVYLDEKTHSETDENLQLDTENKANEDIIDNLQCGNTSHKLSQCIEEPNPENLDTTKGDLVLLTKESEDMKEQVRPRSFAAVLKASASENTLEKPTNPDGQPVDKLPSKVIKGIKENISPENTLTSSMTNTKALVFELDKVKSQPIVSTVWEMADPLTEKEYPVFSHEMQCFYDNAESLEKASLDSKDTKHVDRDRPKAPIATIEEACEDLLLQCSELQFLDDIKFIDEKPVEERVVILENVDTEETKILERVPSLQAKAKVLERISSLDKTRDDKTEKVDLAKDALTYLIYDNQDFDPEMEATVSEVKTEKSSLAQELQDAENIQKIIDLSPELVIDDSEVFSKEFPSRSSPLIPERAKLKKANSLENLLGLPDKETSPKTKTIAFKIPETSPRDIPRKPKLRSRSGSSPKSLPESLNKCPSTTLDSKKKKKVSSLGKIAKDSLLALNMTEEELAEFRRSYKLTSVESLRSLESVSEDANSQSGTSADSRCRACLRTSQESLMSLDSISEDCRCSDSDKGDKLSRSAR